MQKKLTNSKDKTRPIKKSLSQKGIRPNPSPDKDPAVKTVKNSSPSTNTSGMKKRKFSKRPSKILPPREEYLLNDSSVDSINFKQETEQVKDQVLKSLEAFRVSANEYMEKARGFEEEVSSFGLDFAKVKHEIESVYRESTKSKDEILNIRKNFSLSPKGNMSVKQFPEAHSDFYSSGPKVNPKERLNNLQKEMQEIRENVRKAEEEAKVRRDECDRLKEIACRLQGKQNKDSFKEKQLATCRSCCIS